MTEKEVSELRRRLRPDKNGITHICGCYVNNSREVISQFNQSLAMATQEESEMYLALFKRTLSGGLGKNLIDITFRTAQVADSEEHRLLMKLRDSSLRDEEAVQAFYQRVIEAVSLEGNYLILLARDAYDVPYRAKDGVRLEDSSNEVYSYVVCSICPVKMTKPSLSYFSEEKEFHNSKTGWIVSAPEMGFLFPAFDNRSTNLYNALYYSHDVAQGHPEFVDAVFRVETPMPAAVQKETFQGVLANALDEDCSFELVQTVHEQLRERIEAHKESKVEEPLTVSKREVREVLESCGVSETHMAAFDVQFDTEFGTGTELSPRNLVDSGQFEVRTPDVVIRVNPERSDLIETRVINGTKYLLICADEGVEVNGVNVHIADGV